VKSKTYTQNKQPSDKTQSSKFCQLGVKRTRFQNRKKKGNDFFDRSTTLSEDVSVAPSFEAPRNVKSPMKSINKTLFPSNTRENPTKFPPAVQFI